MSYFSELAAVGFSACFANKRTGIETVQSRGFFTRGLHAIKCLKRADQRVSVNIELLDRAL